MRARLFANHLPARSSAQIGPVAIADAHNETVTDRRRNVLRTMMDSLEVWLLVTPHLKKHDCLHVSLHHISLRNPSYTQAHFLPVQ